jgi:hypothetical protein
MLNKLDEKLIFLNMATFHQEQMGYKEGWIYVVFKKKFGTWPNDLFKEKTPIEPSPEFLDWVKNQRNSDFKKGGENLLLVEQAKLKALHKLHHPRKGKTASQLAKRFGITERTVQRYTSIPRAEYENNSLTRLKPWEALGMSRATWYRNGKPEAPPLASTKPE